MSNQKAEKAYLGCVFADPSWLDRCDVEVDDFGDPTHQIIYDAMKCLHDQGKPAEDYLVLKAEINGMVDPSVLWQYVFANDVFLPHGQYYADLIIEASDRRRFTEALNLAAKIGLSGKLAVDEATAVLEEGISHRQRKVASIQEAVGNVWDQTEEYQNHPLPPGTVRDLDTGWPDLNRYTGGWSSGLHIIIAVPHIGKSWFVLHTAAHAASNGKNVLFFPLEMTSKQLITRLCTAHSRVRRTGYKSGKMTSQQRAAFYDKMGEVADWDLTIDDTASSLAQVTASVRRAHRRKAVDLVVVDPLGLLAREKSENRNVQLGNVTATLKLLSREIDAPILVPHHVSDKQINQRGENKRPKAADAYESGHIHQNADLLLGLYRDDMHNENSEQKDILEVLMLKDREGGETGGRVYLVCDEFGNMWSQAKEQEDPIWRGGQ